MFSIPKKKKKRATPLSQGPSVVATARASPVPVVAVNSKKRKAEAVHNPSSTRLGKKKNFPIHAHKKASYRHGLNRKRPRSAGGLSGRPRHIPFNKARGLGKRPGSGSSSAGRQYKKSHILNKHKRAKVHGSVKHGRSRPKKLLSSRSPHRQDKHGHQLLPSETRAKIRKSGSKVLGKSSDKKKKQSTLAWSKSSPKYVPPSKSHRSNKTKKRAPGKPVEAKGNKKAKSKQSSEPNIHPKKRKQKLLLVNKQTEADAQVKLKAAQEKQEQRRREKEARKIAKRAAKKAKKKAERKQQEKLEKLRDKLTKTCRVCNKKSFSISVQYDDERLFSADLTEGVSSVEETVKATDLIQCTACQMRVHCRCYLDCPISVPVKEWRCRMCSYQLPTPANADPPDAGACPPASEPTQDASSANQEGAGDVTETTKTAASAADSSSATVEGKATTSSATNLSEPGQIPKNVSGAAAPTSEATTASVKTTPLKKLIDSKTGLPICMEIEWPTLPQSPDMVNHKDYGSLISFLCKFNECKDLNLTACTHAAVEQGLLYPTNSDFLIGLHVNLLKGIGKAATPANWCDTLLEVVSAERHKLGLDPVPDMVQCLEEYNYARLSLENRIAILNNLCDIQFHQNKTFGAALRTKNKSGRLDFNSHVLRGLPMGIDRRKIRYWLFEDPLSEVRVFTERLDRQHNTASWELVINSHDGVRVFIDSLSRSNLTCELLLWRNLRRRIKIIEKTALKKAQARKREERRIQAQQRQELYRIARQFEGRSQRRCRKAIDYSSASYDKQFDGLFL